MLDKIRALAMEKLASEAEVDAFMAGFESAALEKAGSFMDVVTSRPFVDGATKAGFGLGASLLGAGIVRGISTASRHSRDNQLRAKFDMALAQVMATNKIVKGARPEKARQYAETMFTFAPHVASDANLLGSILSNAVLGESIDPQTIKTLVDLEGRYVDNNKITPLVGIKA
jgi:hypothetical protein